MIFSPWTPCIDILRGNDHWLVKVELAGVCSDDVTISASANILTVQGGRRDSQLFQGLSYHLMEINYSRFERSVKLPFYIDASDLSWKCSDGILHIQVRDLRDKSSPAEKVLQRETV